MVSKRIKINFAVCLVLLSLMSCSKYSEGVNFALNQSGDNKEQLIKALEHFSQKKEDSLKLKSAEILIPNIPFYSYKIGFKKYEKVFDNLEEYRRNLKKDTTVGKGSIMGLVRDRFVQNSDSITKYLKKDISFQINDIDTINSKFLIDNINLAFEAHNRLPKEYQSNFNDFNIYFLP